MEQIKRTCKKLLYPHWILILLLTIVSAGLLVWMFLNRWEERWFAYPVYVLSFYTLMVFCLWIIPIIVKTVGKKKQERQNMDAAQKRKKFRDSLYRGMVVNLAFAAFNMVGGYFRASVWMGSNGLYHLVLTVIHLILVTYDAKLEKTEDLMKRQRMGWSGFQFCGAMLFLLHLTMTGMVFQMIWRGETEKYPGLLIFAVAAYTFYKLMIALIRVIRFRKNTTPILGASKNIDLSEAMMSLLSLQSGLLTAFGQGDVDFAFLMNSLTGGAVCLSAVLGAVGMIFHGRNKKKALLEGKENVK